MGERLKKADEIATLFKDSLADPAKATPEKVAALVKPNEKLLSEFQNLSRESTSFVRGEIENEATLSQMIAMLELSILRIRNWEQQKPLKRKFAQIKEEAGTWFQFAADLPYNEASLVGLRVTGVIRSFLIDELERLEKSSGDEMARDELWLNWLVQLRTPWPVDRMILTEAKRVLHPSSMNLAEKVAQKIQKNPYLSIEAALKQIPGHKPKELQDLKAIWRDQDMDGMKTEINRLQTLRLRLATRLFEKRKGKRPDKPQDLVTAGLLAQVPIDYFTGKAMQLPQADKAPSDPKNP